MTPISEESLKRTAEIIGENSGAAQALKKAEEHRAAGKYVHFYRYEGVILVVAEN